MDADSSIKYAAHFINPADYRGSCRVQDVLHCCCYNTMLEAHKRQIGEEGEVCSIAFPFISIGESEIEQGRSASAVVRGMRAFERDNPEVSMKVLLFTSSYEEFVLYSQAVFISLIV